MKAWRVYNKLDYYGSIIIFAEKRSKAIYNALQFTDEFEDCEWTDLRARRFPEYDPYYSGRSIVDFWGDDEHRIRLVRDFGWYCFEPDFYCEDCPAKQYCTLWERKQDDRSET